MRFTLKFAALALLGLVPLAIGCGGPGKPESGASDAATEKADAELAPEAGPGETPEASGSAASDDGTAAPQETPADAASEEAPAPEK